MIIAIAFSAGSVVRAQQQGIENFQRMTFGVFVHYVWGGTAYTATVNPDGSKPSGLNDLADRFDETRFAEDLASFGAEYVIFTAWHANMNCLWPSSTMEHWLPGHGSQRDVVGDMIKAVRAKGIRVLLYTHPTDGHDLTSTEQTVTGWGPVYDRAKWNDFVNELYAELIARYGRDIEGVYIDEHGGKNGELIDYPRLRSTVKAGNPRLLMLQNDYGRIYNCDFGDEELYQLPSMDADTWPARSMPSALLVSREWWAGKPDSFYVPKYSAESLFRYTVLKAGITSAGGVAVAAGNYPGGKWERGITNTFRLLAQYLRPIGRAITNTFASTSYPTSSGATIRDLDWGVATRSADDQFEFLHVLNPPTGKTLKLPPPADGRHFASARLLSSGGNVAFAQNASGLILTLSANDNWELLDTVIELSLRPEAGAPADAGRGDQHAGPSISIAKKLTFTATNISGDLVTLSPTPGMSRWFDAASLKLKNGAEVPMWDDLSGNEAHAVRPAGDNRLPTYVADAGTGTGQGAVHFGPGRETNPALNSQALMFRSTFKVRTVVSVFKGSSFLLTDHGAIDFHRLNDTNSATPLWSAREASPYILGGATYVNGVAVDGTTFSMPTNLHNGFNLVTVVATNTVTASSFNRDRDCHAGDQYQAEVLIYEFPLNDSERRQTEAYLRAKWFGELGPVTTPKKEETAR